MTTTLTPPTPPTTAGGDAAAGTAPAGGTGPRGSRPGRPLSARGVLLSEWVKLRSVRSSTTTLLATAGTMLLLGAIAAAVNGGLLSTAPADGGGGPGGPGGSDPTAIALTGSLLAPLIIGVLGAMVMTSEHATGTIRTTMTLVPRRLPVLWSKAAVLAVVTVPVMMAATLVTFFVGQGLLGAGGSATASLGDPGVLRAVLGTGAYLGAVALMGLAVGTLLRGTASSVSVLVALIFLLPGLGGFLLPASWRDHVLLYLPSNAASAFTSVAPGPDLLGAWAGAGVLAAWVVVPLLAAAVVLRRRAV